MSIPILRYYLLRTDLSDTRDGVNGVRRLLVRLGHITQNQALRLFYLRPLFNVDELVPIC